MELFLFWLGAVALTLGLHLAVLPLFEKRLSSGRAKNLSYQTGLLAVLSTIASVAFMAVISIGLALCFIWLIQLQGGNSAATVSAGLERVRQWREIWLAWTPAWGFGAALLLVLALMIFAARKASIRCERTIAAAREREFNLLFERWKQDALDDLPPTEEMNQLWQQIEAARGAAAMLPLDDSSVAERRKQLDDHVNQLTRAFIALDLRRRMKDEIDPDLVRIPQPRTRWEKVQTFFISQGLLVNLGRANRVVFALGLLLLFPCLIGVSRPLGLASIEAKMSQLGSLRLRLSAQEVKADWEAEKQKTEGQTALSAEDLSVIATIAREWEKAEADAPLFSASAANVAPNFAVRALSVRDHILRRSAEQRPAQLDHRNAAIPDAVDKPPAAMASEMPDADGRSLGPETASGKRVQAELSEKAARAPPKFMERLRSEVAAFQKPATAQALRRAAAVQVASALVDGNAADSIFSQAARAVDAQHRELLHTRAEAAADRFLTSVSRGEPIDQAIRKSRAPEALDHLFTPAQLDDLQQVVRRAGPDLPDNERLMRQFQDHPPSIETKPDLEPNRRAATVLDEYRSVSGREGPQLVSLTESLNSYPDYFPGQLGAEANTPRGDLTRKWEGGAEATGASPDLPATGAREVTGSGGAGGGGNRQPHGSSGTRPGSASTASHVPKPATRANFARARSFAGLRGFSRVGGVLVGRGPEPGDTFEIEGLRWETLSDARVQLILRDAGGREYRSMGHRAELVAQALTYAADGRPLAATMATAQPLMELKILLHPALVDTAMGATIVELDRFVDIYTDESAFRREATEQVMQQTFLYRLAWAERVLLLEPEVPRLSQLYDIARRWRDNEQFRKIAAEGIARGALAFNSSSVLEVKSEFYESSLVHAMKETGATDLEAFLAAIKSAFALTGTESKEVLENWLGFPPEFEVWSGVREKPYRLTASELLIGEGQPIPMPFDFMLQVAFTADPAFGAQRNAEEDTYTDSKPWEFPALKDAIQKSVVTNVATDSEQAAVLRDAAEFTLLQRLFRCALEGRFGENFPIESLDRLAAKVGKTPVATTHTPRWNSRPGAIEKALYETVVSVEQAGSEIAPESVSAQLHACADLLKKNFERRQQYQKQIEAARAKSRTGNPAALDLIWARLDADLQTWETAWTPVAAELQSAASATPPLLARLEGFGELNAALKLRRALGVQEEERPSLRK